MIDIYEKIGFYYMVFQRGLNDNFVKCWMDGDDNWSYIPKAEIFEIMRKAESSRQLILIMENCLKTTSIYIWDVSNKSIKRMNPSTEIHSYMGELLRNSPFIHEKEEEKVSYDISTLKKIKSFFRIRS